MQNCNKSQSIVTTGKKPNMDARDRYLYTSQTIIHELMRQMCYTEGGPPDMETLADTIRKARMLNGNTQYTESGTNGASDDTLVAHTQSTPNIAPETQLHCRDTRNSPPQAKVGEHVIKEEQTTRRETSPSLIFLGAFTSEREASGTKWDESSSEGEYSISTRDESPNEGENLMSGRDILPSAGENPISGRDILPSTTGASHKGKEETEEIVSKLCTRRIKHWKRAVQAGEAIPDCCKFTERHGPLKCEYCSVRRSPCNVISKTTAVSLLRQRQRMEAAEAIDSKSQESWEARFHFNEIYWQALGEAERVWSIYEPPRRRKRGDSRGSDEDRNNPTKQQKTHEGED